MFTPDEAKTKWCPFVRLADTSANRWKQSLPENEPYALNPVPCRCIASDCMAWRWDVETIDKDTGFKVTTEEMYGRMKEGATASQFHDRWASHGYCGIAGRPA